MTVKNVMIITDDHATVGELCSGGRQLGENVSVVLFGDHSVAEEAISFGADNVFLFEHPGDNGMVEANSKAIAELIREDKADLVMVHSSVSGKLMAGKIASHLGTSAISNISEFNVEDGNIVVKHLVYGGAAVRTEKALAETFVVTVGSGVFETAEKDPSRQGKVTEIPSAENAGIKVVEVRPKQEEAVNLGAANRVVGVGRGFAAKDDLNMAEELASLVRGELACTRPIAEGEQWMSKDRYIGVSSLVLKPDVYFAIGISGQIQHMVGVNQAKTIVAINKDKNAPIFKQADIGLVGDLYTVLPKIIEQVKA